MFQLKEFQNANSWEQLYQIYNLSWNANIKYLVKKANARMQLLHKISNFGAPYEDLKMIYIAYIRSILEQSSNVWHSSLTKEDEENIERDQKSSF